MAYRLSFASDVHQSFRACMREELAVATDQLRDEFEDDPVEAIHEARKSLKKARSLLRLVRPGLGKRVYRRENRALRDAGRLISGARDADVLVETAEVLADRYAGRLPARDFDALLDHLRAAAQASRAGTASGDGRVEVVEMLDGVAGRIDDWPLEDGDWSTVAAGMELAYGRGRTAFAAADDDPTVERLHDWRKRVKDYWYHQRLTGQAWPDLLGAQAEAGHRLSELLGDDHDLAILAELLRDDDARPPEPSDPSRLLDLIAERRAELLAGARHLGALIYAERASAFGRRSARYLEQGRAAARAATAGEAWAGEVAEARGEDVGGADAAEAGAAGGADGGGAGEAVGADADAGGAGEAGGADGGAASEAAGADAGGGGAGAAGGADAGGAGEAGGADAGGQEIERKFLVSEVPGDLADHPSEAIEQGYVVVEGGAEVRVRRRDERTLLTVKAGSGRVRVEEEFEIDERRFASLWPLSEGRRVAKRRHRLPGGEDLTIELDVYTGELDGLVLAEVEFSSVDASDAYAPPRWFGPEVTDDLRYANRALAVDGAPAGPMCRVEK